ncbi:bifunctional RNase H/acid phosphatase [Streptomonospora sp. S1-112]|uniref:Bifunctional RNase H/acid phosphatase n=1 Tax=Streptomonospora mangrovi TaxID=2883123 RepID=A0A9X3SF05_9ACTN|nr:bifunctional RNase H/acid phosphatase [Streptomonospora mangrovi]MDA0566428.1 bifunctional RNase H/acid phosphatase [Streptomonospora mangrovi]
MSRRLIVEADGGSRGNPGPAGYGAVVRDAATGTVLAEIAESIGTATNNAAEYQGLIAGLAAAARLDPAAEVEARLDSKLVVEQMAGRWRVKHPDLRPLHERARDTAEQLGAVRYTWVPRARNAHADRLANEAMDAAAEGRPVRLDTAESPEPWEPVGAGAAASAEGAPGGGTAGAGADASAHGGPAAPAEGSGASEDPAPAPADAGAAPDPAADADTGAQPGVAGSAAATGWAAPDTSPTRLILLRHGETPLSSEQRFAGVGDIALTDTGHAQARAAARHLADSGIDAIVSSPLRRTRDTADPIAAELGLSVEEEPDLRELDFGAWEGMTFGEVQEAHPEELARWLANPHTAPFGAESFAEVAHRVAEARDRLLSRHARKTILVVSHVTPIKVLLQQALGAPPEALFRMHLDVGCLSRIDCYSDGPMVVRALNDTGHLTGHLA